MKPQQQKNNVSDDSQRITLSKTSDNGREGSSASPMIPVEVITDIFSRLPLKSIAKCRCVSKLWASVLRLPDFTDLFLTKSLARPKLLHARVTNSELFLYSSSSPNPDENSSSPVVATCHMKLPFGGFGDISCGRPVYGLVMVCVKHVRVLDKEKEAALTICNPSTRQVLHLPKAKTTSGLEVRSMFGYDPVDKQHKVLCMTLQGMEESIKC